MKLTSLIAFLLIPAFAITARGQSYSTAIDILENRGGVPPCCKKIMEEVKENTLNFWVRTTNIGIFVNQSAEGRMVVAAGVYGCYPAGKGKLSTCSVYVTKKMLRLFDEDELFAVLAHESVHIEQRGEGRWFEKQIALEYEADERTINLLVFTGRNPETLIRAINTSLRKSGKLSKKDRTVLQSRLMHAKKFLADMRSTPPA